MHTHITQDKVRKLARWINQLLKEKKTLGLAQLNNEIWNIFGAKPGGSKTAASAQAFPETQPLEYAHRLLVKVWSTNEYINADLACLAISPSLAKQLLFLSELVKNQLGIEGTSAHDLLSASTSFSLPCQTGCVVTSSSPYEEFELEYPDSGWMWSPYDPTFMFPESEKARFEVPRFTVYDDSAYFKSSSALGEPIDSDELIGALRELAEGKVSPESRIARLHEDQNTGLLVPTFALKPIQDYCHPVFPELTPKLNEQLRAAFQNFQHNSGPFGFENTPAGPVLLDCNP